MPKLVYLDQNHWITLARQQEGLGNNDDVKKSLDAVKRASKKGDTRFPLSFVHLTETCSTRNRKRRESLAKFMVDISCGYTIIPYVSVMNAEVQQAMVKQLGLCTTDLRQFVVGRGIPAILGSKLELIDAEGLPADFKTELLQKIEEPETLLRCMTDEGIIEAFRKSRSSDTEVVEKLEKIRKEDEKIPDKDSRRRISFAKFFKSDILPEMVRITNALGVKPQQVMPESMTEEDAEKFFLNIRTAYTSFTLTHKRDVQRHRRIDKHDFNDLAALSIAIPYCDIVVTEKFWTALATQEKLDKIYNTHILSSVSELHKFV